MLPLIANSPEGRIFTNNPLWKILNCRIVWPLKCFLIRSLARSVYCTFRIHVQWMCRIYSLIDITKMIWSLARRTCIYYVFPLFISIDGLVKLASTLTGWKQFFRSRSFHNKTGSIPLTVKLFYSDICRTHPLKNISLSLLITQHWLV